VFTLAGSCKLWQRMKTTRARSYEESERGAGYGRRPAELEALVADKKSDYFGDKQALHDPDEYRRVGAFNIPEAARCENVRRRRRSRLSMRVSDLYNLSPRVSP
jgi:hypothetical protein